MTRPDDNLFLAISAPIAVTVLLSLACRKRVPFLSVIATLISVAVWMILLRIWNGDWGILWPAGCVVWFVWFWPVAAVVRVPFLLRDAGREFRSHDCLNCGYSLTGKTSGVCPECGKPVTSAPDAASR